MPTNFNQRKGFSQAKSRHTTTRVHLEVDSALICRDQLLSADPNGNDVTNLGEHGRRAWGQIVHDETSAVFGQQPSAQRPIHREVNLCCSGMRVGGVDRAGAQCADRYVISSR